MALPMDVPRGWRATLTMVGLAAAGILAWTFLGGRVEVIADARASVAVAPVNADLQTHKATDQMRHDYEDRQLKEINESLKDIRERIPPKRER